MSKSQALMAALLCAGALLQPLTAAAQSYPSKPVRIIVPYPPGGSVDLTGRLVAQGLQQVMGQSFVVENRGGAGGAIGTDVVAKAAPDGYTLLVVAPGAMTVIAHFQKLAYDPVKDFTAITRLITSPLLLSVNTSVPVKNVTELLAYVKTQPGGVNFSSTGPGSLSLLAGELLKMMTGANLTVVTYNGGAPAAAAIAAGQVPFGITDSAPVFPLEAAGKVRVLALTEPTRIPSKPNIPTVAESGLPGYEAASWVAFFAPAGTPGDIVNRLHSDVVKSFNNPEIRDRAEKSALDTTFNGPEAMTRLLRSDFEKWRKVITSAGLKAQ
jgi:tripartite-type tricarboxylate transporter receptor subunit TctC